MAQQKTAADYEREAAAMRAELEQARAALAAKPTGARITFKVAPKGGLQVGGLGRFPTTLYVEQWQRIIAAMPEMQAFIRAHAREFSHKTDEAVGNGNGVVVPIRNGDAASML